MSKKIIAAVILSLFFTLPFFASALNFPGFHQGQDLVYDDIINIRDSVVSFVWAIFGGFALIMFIVAGFLFLTAHGDPGKTSLARNALLGGVIGVAVAILSTTIPFIILRSLFP